MKKLAFLALLIAFNSSCGRRDIFHGTSLDSFPGLTVLPASSSALVLSWQSSSKAPGNDVAIAVSASSSASCDGALPLARSSETSAIVKDLNESTDYFVTLCASDVPIFTDRRRTYAKPDVTVASSTTAPALSALLAGVSDLNADGIVAVELGTGTEIKASAGDAPVTISGKQIQIYAALVPGQPRAKITIDSGCMGAGLPGTPVLDIARAEFLRMGNIQISVGSCDFSPAILVESSKVELSGIHIDVNGAGSPAVLASHSDLTVTGASLAARGFKTNAVALNHSTLSLISSALASSGSGIELSFEGSTLGFSRSSLSRTEPDADESIDAGILFKSDPSRPGEKPLSSVVGASATDITIHGWKKPFAEEVRKEGSAVLALGCSEYVDDPDGGATGTASVPAMKLGLEPGACPLIP